MLYEVWCHCLASSFASRKGLNCAILVVVLSITIILCEVAILAVLLQLKHLNCVLVLVIVAGGSRGRKGGYLRIEIFDGLTQSYRSGRVGIS